jgi:hypothetical protein
VYGLSGTFVVFRERVLSHTNVSRLPFTRHVNLNLYRFVADSSQNYSVHINLGWPLKLINVKFDLCFWTSRLHIVSRLLCWMNERCARLWQIPPTVFLCFIFVWVYIYGVDSTWRFVRHLIYVSLRDGGRWGECGHLRLCGIIQPIEC